MQSLTTLTPAGAEASQAVFEGKMRLAIDPTAEGGGQMTTPEAITAAYRAAQFQQQRVTGRPASAGILNSPLPRAPVPTFDPGLLQQGVAVGGPRPAVPAIAVPYLDQTATTLPLMQGGNASKTAESEQREMEVLIEVRGFGSTRIYVHDVLLPANGDNKFFIIQRTDSRSPSYSPPTLTTTVVDMAVQLENDSRIFQVVPTTIDFEYAGYRFLLFTVVSVFDASVS